MLLALLAAPLTHAGEAAKLSNEERAILCFDLKSLVSIQEETATLNDMSARLQRVQDTVGEVSRMIAAMPDPGVALAPPPPPATAPMLPAASHPLWLPLAIGGGLIGLLGLLWSRRRRKGATASVSAVAGQAPLPEAVTAPFSAPSIAPEDPSFMPQPESPPPGAPAAGPRGELPEVDEALELADVMVSMGLAEGAADALVDHIRSNPRRALFHWLKLLDIYKTAGNKEDFEKSAQELRRNFNIQADEWHDDTAAAMPSIEDYERLCRHLQERWRQPGCIDFLVDLLGDNRGGTRQGFPQAVAEEILLLISILRQDE